MREYLLRPIVGSARLSQFVAAMTRTEFSRPLDLAGFAREWLTAWNAHDLERILAHYSEDVELTSPFVAKLTGRSEGVLRGKAALRDYFARGLTSSGFTPVCGVAFWNTAASTACARQS